jgi:hypothetical protein
MVMRAVNTSTTTSEGLTFTMAAVECSPTKRVRECSMASHAAG